MNVGAKRGPDLGTAQNACISNDRVRTLLAKYGEEQYRRLMKLSTNDSRIRTRRVIRSIGGCSRRWAIAGKELELLHSWNSKRKCKDSASRAAGASQKTQTAEVESCIRIQP